ncbi:unnamed protein product [Rhodiola kirilowii]
MEIGQSVKGTVTSLSSMFSHEEAQGAARYVEEAIAERTKELDRLRSFVDDNSGLVKLVQRLPDQLHHDIMVPFGKGAFFPGSLIHTNEFLVLLGEGYYADRTSKQTVDILNRRGKELDSQVESLKAMIKDLKAEASFFGDTATEAAEGVVEIREEYVKEDPTEEVSLKAKDEEFARIMARMEELEEAELAAESENNNDERLLSGNEVEEAEEDELLTGNSGERGGQEQWQHRGDGGARAVEHVRVRTDVQREGGGDEAEGWRGLRMGFMLMLTRRLSGKGPYYCVIRFWAVVNAMKNNGVKLVVLEEGDSDL